jgi:hypothetical protein
MTATGHPVNFQSPHARSITSLAAGKFQTRRVGRKVLIPHTSW